MSVFDEHLSQYDGAQLQALVMTITTIRTTLPNAVEVIAYGMPTFKAGDEKGPAIIAVSGFRNHNSLFPYSGSITTTLKSDLDRYEQTKGSIHFDRDKPFPATVLRKVLRERIREINASYPKKSGEWRAYAPDGSLKAKGRLKPAR